MLGLTGRFEEYPKLQELIRLKDDLISETAHPPMYLKVDLESYDLKQLNCKFDTIIIGAKWFLFMYKDTKTFNYFCMFRASIRRIQQTVRCN